jgi:hypothetical protein
LPKLISEEKERFSELKKKTRKLYMYIIGKTWMRMSKPYGEFEKAFG